MAFYHPDLVYVVIIYNVPDQSDCKIYLKLHIPREHLKELVETTFRCKM